MNIDDNYDTSAKPEFVFTPVSVNGGRKFRGQAYYLGRQHDRVNSFGSIISKLYCPGKGFVYANSNFAEPVEAESEKIEADRAEYVKFVVADLAEHARTKLGIPDDRVRQYVRSCVRKYYVELLPFVADEFPDDRDAYAEIEKTLEWAMSLCSRPAVIYGKVCRGGTPYPDKKRIGIAWRALHTRGIDKLDGFDEAWGMQLTLRGLLKYDPRVRQTARVPSSGPDAGL